MDTPYALVKDGRGDVCAIPIVVGVSPALYAQHRQRVGMLWPRTTDSAPVENGQRSAVEQLLRDDEDVKEMNVDRVLAYHACAAVQSAETLARTAPPEIDTARGSTAYATASNSNSPTASDVISTQTHHGRHHPLPTPSPSPNDDQQAQHHALLTNGGVDGLCDDGGISPPSEGSDQCLQPMITISSKEQAFIRWVD